MIPAILRSNVHLLIPQVIAAVTIFDRPNGRLSSILRPYLLQNRLHMDLDGGLGNIARPSDHLVGMSFYQTFQNLLLALG